MTGHMHAGARLVVHIGADLGQRVDHLRDGFFVAGNRRCRDDDGVSRFHIDGLMLACCDTGQCRQRLALATRAHDDHLLRRDALQVVRIDDVLVGDLQISQLASDIGVLHHGAAGDDHLAPVCHGGIADLLQAMDMAGERRDDDAALCLRDDALKLLADFGLAGREVGVGGVRGIRHHQVNALFGEACKSAEIGMHAVDGGLIKLEVARVQHVASGAAEKDAHGTRDGVVHGEELGGDAAQVHLVTRLDFHKLGVFDSVLLELAFDQAQGHLRAVNGHLTIQVFNKIRQGTRMVLMAVRDHDAAQLVGVLEHVGVIRKDKIHAGMIVIGKHEAGIVEHHVALALEHGHVLADGVKAAERDDLQRGSTVFFRGVEGALTRARTLTTLIGVALFRELRALKVKLNVLDRLRAFAAVLRAHTTVALRALFVLIHVLISLLPTYSRAAWIEAALLRILATGRQPRA